MSTNNLTLLQRAILATLFLYPILLLSVQGGTNVLFFILFVISVAVWIDLRLWLTVIKDRSAIFFSLAMASPLVATLSSQAYHGTFDSLYWDAPARFLLAIPIFYALKNSALPIISALKYAFPLGAISALFAVLYTQYFGVQEFGQRASISYLNPIHFGNLALILSILSASFIAPIKHENFNANTLQISGLIAGVLASALSGTRSGWIVIPIVLIAWLLLNRKAGLFKRAAIGLMAISVVAISGYLLIDVIQQRVHETMSEIVFLMNGDFSSSLGQRIQLWIAGFYMFVENPVFGVGPSEFFHSVDKLQVAGIIHSFPQYVYGTEVHNYYVATMAELGILGLLSALAIFVVPLSMFFRAASSQIDTVKISAAAGTFFVLGFFIFCITVEMFNIKMIASFYALTVAALLAATSSVETANKH